MSKRHLYWLTGILAFIAVAIFAYKYFLLGFPVTSEQRAEVWNVEARIAFTARGRPVRADFMVPKSTPSLPILRESYMAGDFGRTTRALDDNRRATFSIQRAKGEVVLYYRAAVQVTGQAPEPAREAAPDLKRRAMTPAEQAAAGALMKRIRPRAAGIPTLVALLINALRQAQPGDEATLLLGASRGTGDITEAAVKVLQHAGIPARRVSGLQLGEDRRNASLTHWIEVYYGDRWAPFSAFDGNPGAPSRTVVWWRGAEPALSLTGADRPRVSFTVSRAQQFALDAALLRGRQAQEGLVQFSLFGLPLQVQQVYRILLVVPIGVLLLVVLRNIVGIKTFGTFMPVLIAMSFRETNLLWGIVLFILIVFLGMSVRFYFDRLKLLLVPRLASVVIVVIGLMAILSVITFKMGVERGLSIALFPIVILTMTIERMTVVWEERGPKESMLQATGSLATAVLAYLVMNLEAVEHLVFVFPELLLIVLAATLLLGRYSGYRLTEIPRFRVLARAREP